MRKIAVLVLGLMVAGCAQPVNVARDVHGAAARGTLPPEIPKDQQIRVTDGQWKATVAACVVSLEGSPSKFSPAEAGRFCGCTSDLTQTRLSAAKLAQIGFDMQGGKPPSPRETPEMMMLIVACWPR